MFKKICSVCLALFMILGIALCTAGCGDSKVKLIWAGSTLGNEESEMVFEAFNKELQSVKGFENVEIDFQKQDTTNWQLWMASNTQIDIAWTGYSYDIETEINNGSYTALDEYITEENTPNIYAEKQEYSADYASGSYKGKQYLIPNQQPIANLSNILKIPVELKDYMNIDGVLNECHSNKKTTEKVYQYIDEYLAAVTKAHAIDTDTVAKYIDIQGIFKFVATRGYEFIGGDLTGAWLCYDEEDPSAKIVNFMETDAYRLFLKYAAKWYNDGYVSPNVLVNGSESGSRSPVLNAHSTGMWYATENPELGEERGVTYAIETDDAGNKFITMYNLLLETPEQDWQGVSTLGSEKTYLCIPYTSKNPEIAIKLLDLLRAPVGEKGNDLLNLLVYGFEENSKYAEEYGTYHYTLEGDCAYGVDYYAQPDSSCKYGIAHWFVGNVFKTYRTPNIQAGQGDYVKKYETVDRLTHKETALCGFRVDLSEYSNVIANIQTIINEYNDTLICGIDGSNYNATYDEMMSKINGADLAKVKEAVQSQADKYISE
ncbi:MAG: DUF3502 domain-containing protein [Clostridia bacterium]|nr:DUF3502 domain-containing protein [Clostridia bacterium]